MTQEPSSTTTTTTSTTTTGSTSLDSFLRQRRFVSSTFEWLNLSLKNLVTSPVLSVPTTMYRGGPLWNQKKGGLPASCDSPIRIPGEVHDFSGEAHDFDNVLEKLMDVKGRIDHLYREVQQMKNTENSTVNQNALCVGDINQEFFPFKPLSSPFLDLSSIHPSCTALSSRLYHADHFYPFWTNVIAGSVAVPLSFAVVHPIDVIKTQMQAAIGSKRIPGGFMAQLKHGLRTAGSKVLTRGFASSMIGAVPQGGLRFGTYGLAQETLDPYFDSPTFRNALCAVIGDLASSTVKVPREVVVQRVQTGFQKDGREVVKALMKKEGFKGLFTGYWTTCARDVPFMMVTFVSYEQFKSWKLRISTSQSRSQDHLRNEPTLDVGHHLSHSPVPTHKMQHSWHVVAEENRKLSDFETIIWGGISGALAGVSTTPIDVVKTRVMTSEAGEYRRVRNVVNSILKEEGPRGLFTGVVARGTWWFIVCSVFFASFERMRRTIT